MHLKLHFADIHSIRIDYPKKRRMILYKLNDELVINTNKYYYSYNSYFQLQHEKFIHILTSKFVKSGCNVLFNFGETSFEVHSLTIITFVLFIECLIIETIAILIFIRII